MKVLIVASSKLPVPAVKGGAVPTLIEELISQNEKECKLELICCSIYDNEAEIQANKYKNTKFIWAKIPMVISVLDKVFYFILSKIFRVKRLLSLRYLFQVLWLSFFVGKVIHKDNYDHIVFENSIPVLFSMKLYSNKNKYKDKYSLHMHSVPRKYYGNERIIRDCKNLICISDYVAGEILKDKRLYIDESKIKIMYNCIDTNLFKSQKVQNQSLREKYSISKDAKIIVFVGRLCKEKGIEELLRAISGISSQKIVLFVVGANFYKSGIVSPYEEKLKALVNPISDKVIFTGYVDYVEIPEYYRLADVIVLPSMWEEPAGMTIIEAMACGRPVITTYSGGIPEYTGENNCLLLQRDEDIVENLQISIMNVLSDKDFADNLSAKASTKAEKYNQEYYYHQFLKIIGLGESIE